jgi:sugar lactone lactonase YvrE
MALVSTLPRTVSQAQNGFSDLPTGIWPRALAYDPDGKILWVANGFDHTVIRYDEATGNPLDKTTNQPVAIDPIKAPLSNAAIQVGLQPAAMAWDSFHHTMWVAGYDDVSLTLITIDPTGKKAPSIQTLNSTQSHLNGQPVAMVYADTYIWVVGQNQGAGFEDAVWLFDTVKYQALTKITVGAFPTSIVAFPDDKTPHQSLLWVTNGNDDTISTIDLTKIDLTKSTNATKDPFKATVPAFPISAAFDSAGLWVGNYFNTDDHKHGAAVRLDSLVGQVMGSDSQLGGRGVNVAYHNGHTFVATGHGQSVIDYNSQTAQQNGLGAVMSLITKDYPITYAGTVLATDKAIYVADWLNDRIVRFPPPAAIAINPTPIATATPIPPTATFTPTPAACNAPPQLHTGDIGEVKFEPDHPTDRDNWNADVQIHKQSNTTSPIIGKIAALHYNEPESQKFTVNSEATLDSDPSDTKYGTNLCFYNVTTASSKITGWIVQGYLKGQDRYFVVKSQ